MSSKHNTIFRLPLKQFLTARLRESRIHLMSYSAPRQTFVAQKGQERKNEAGASYFILLYSSKTNGTNLTKSDAERRKSKRWERSRFRARMQRKRFG